MISMISTTEPVFAASVVYRDPCHCDSARPPGEESEHRFDVDGEPFPWLITEEGARFSQPVDSDLVLVSVTMFTVAQCSREFVEFSHDGGFGQLVLGGFQFPWTLTGPVTYHVPTGGDLPTVELTFVALAAGVDVDCEVTLLL